MKIGDKVKIIDTGYCYTNYVDAAKAMNLTRWYCGIKLIGENIDDNEFKIIDIKELPAGIAYLPRPLYAIENTTTLEQHIFEEKGLEKL